MEVELRTVQLQREPAAGDFGFTVHAVEHHFAINHITDGSPAAVAGLQCGDVVSRMNGSNLLGLTLPDVLERLETTENSSLELQIQRSSCPSASPSRAGQPTPPDGGARTPRSAAKPPPPPKPATLIRVSIEDFAELSVTGHRHQQLNQDYMMCELLRNPDGSQRALVAGVFDGHGLLGERAARAAANRLREICLDPHFDPNKFIVNSHDEMRRLFEQLQAVVLKEHEHVPETYEYPGSSSNLTFHLTTHPVFGQAYSMHPHMPPAPIDFGCTAVVAVVCSGMLCVANAGDAGAILCVPGSHECPARVMSERHNAKEYAEAQRIERDFGDKARITPDGYLAPLDHNISQYEVQTTRCLGHKLLRAAGILSTPAIALSPLREARALVLCSDGVSDELQPRDIADRVVDAASAEDAARALCSDAQDFCMEQDQVDDCTVVVVRFSHARLVPGAARQDQSA